MQTVQNEAVNIGMSRAKVDISLLSGEKSCSFGPRYSGTLDFRRLEVCIV